jgi:MFS family permease
LFIILTIQGVAFGLLFAVGTIASQEFAEPHIKGMSTSLQMFLKNIGTSIGVTVMGLIINHAVNIHTGMKNLFLYALILSLVNIVLSFLIPAKTTSSSKSN